MKGVVFDFGGVMTTTTMPERVREITDRLGIPWRVVAEGFDRHRRRYDQGVISLRELYETTFSDGGVSVSEADLGRILEADGASFLYRNERTLALMRRVRAAGFRVGILTNMPPGFVPLFEEHFGDFIAESDALVVSGLERLYKPMPEIYALLESRIGLKGADLVFIDDSEVNLAGAAAAGWRTVRFVSDDQVAADLAKVL